MTQTRGVATAIVIFESEPYWAAAREPEAHDGSAPASPGDWVG
jgi:hypothetical protein